MSARFVPNPAMSRILAADKSMAIGLTEAALDVAEAAEMDAVRGSTERWAGSFHAVPARLVNGVQTAYVYSDHPVATILEFGSVNNPPFRTLTRAAMEVGRFIDGGGDAGD